MRKNALLLILWLLTNLLLAQNTPYTMGFMINGDPMNTMHNFRQTSDHGFILSGDHYLQNPDSAGIRTYGVLVKLDANGQEAWSTRYPKITCNIFSKDAMPVAQALDGGYALASAEYYCSGNYIGHNRILFIKTDTAGIISWAKSCPGTGISFANCIQPTNDHGYIIVGMTRDTSWGGEGDCNYIIKTDSVGNPQWQKSYSDPIYGYAHGIFNSIIQTHDGGYVVCGYNYGPCHQGIIMRLDANGVVRWSLKSDGLLSNFYDVKETNTQHYIVSGKIINANFHQVHGIYKIDDSGNTIWGREITTFPFTADGLSSVVVEDDGYTFAGSFDTSFQQTAIIHTDTSGNVMWYHSFPQTYPTIFPSIALADSGYAYNTGNYYLTPNNSWNRALVILKTDKQGWSTCPMQSPPYTVTSAPPLDPLYLVPVNRNYPVITRDIVSVPMNMADSTFCLTTGIAPELSQSTALSLYPNPTNGNAFLQLPADGEKYRITLYNELGQVVETLRETNRSTVELQTAALAAGIYVVRAVSDNGNSLHIRLVKTE